MSDTIRLDSHEHPDPSKRSRFVVLRHNVGSALSRTAETHFDWMFESGGRLRTFATSPIESFDQSCEGSSESLIDHRLEYLQYEGAIAGARGSVVRILSGDYRLIAETDDRFIAKLDWLQGDIACEASMEFYRSWLDAGLRRDDNRGGWRFRFLPGR